MPYLLVAPDNRKKLWRVENRARNGRLMGEWICDSEEIAREVLKRVEAGHKDPGMVARDLRQRTV